MEVGFWSFSCPSLTGIEGRDKTRVFLQGLDGYGFKFPINTGRAGFDKIMQLAAFAFFVELVVQSLYQLWIMFTDLILKDAIPVRPKRG